MTHKKTDKVIKKDPYKAYQDISNDDNASPEAIGDAWRAVEAYAKNNPTSASAKALGSSKADWQQYAEDAPKRDAADKAWTANLNKNAEKFNMGVDIAKMVGKGIVHSVENTANRIQQDPITAIGSRLANFGSDIGSSIFNIGANASNALFDTNAPNVEGAKLRENYDGGVSFVGGRQNLNPDIGTKSSLGIIVPGKPLESFGRGLEVAGLLPGAGKPLKAVGAATKSAISKVASDGIAAGVTAGARSAISQTVAKKVAPVMLATQALTGTGAAHAAADMSASALRQTSGISRSFEAATGATRTYNPTTGVTVIHLADDTAAKDIPDGVAKVMKQQADAPYDAPAVAPAHSNQNQNQQQQQQASSSSTGETPQERTKPKEKDKTKRPHAINSATGASYGAQEAEIPRIY